MVKASDIRDYFGYSSQGEFDFNITDVKPSTEVLGGSLTFIGAYRAEYLDLLKDKPADILVIIASELKEKISGYCQSFIISDDPRLDFVKALKKFFQSRGNVDSGIHPTAIISPKAKIHKSARIGAYSIIGECEIGENCVIEEYVRIYDKVTIGTGCLIKSQCQIGTDDFGVVKDNDGSWITFPHIGGVEIGDNVEIFPNSIVGRGTLGNTVIKDGVKIDHFCEIGHNTEIGENSVITAYVVVAGSTIVGSGAWIGVGALLRDQIKIGKDVTIGMGSVVSKSVPDGQTFIGNPAEEIGVFKNRRKFLKELEENRK